MNDLTEFQKRACAVAVVKMLNGRHFSVCDLEAIAKTMGRESFMAGRDYQALRAVHCVEWVDMGPELSRMTRDKCLELLGLPPQIVEVFRPETRDELPHAPSTRLRLAVWK